MSLSSFYTKQGTHIEISAKQASQFAKQIAEDFNPIHDEGAKRFCVPGDLLFALTLNEFGLSQKMEFQFAGMVGDGVKLQLPLQVSDEFALKDDKEKTYLTIKRQGDTCLCPTQTWAFIQRYVAFSGLNFIHVLIPLMREHQVMINPDRPLVIYESMSFELEHFDFTEIELSLSKQTLDVNGKRGDVTLHFALTSNGEHIGTGKKTLVLSGLREFDEVAAQQMCEHYESRKTINYD